VITVSILRKADIALIIALTSAAALSTSLLAGFRTGGGYADIIQHGVLVTTLGLSTDTSYHALSGDMANTVQIIGGTAIIISANCPDGHCLRQAPIMYSGQTIVCLPHRLVVQIRAAADSEFDIIIQ